VSSLPDIDVVVPTWNGRELLQRCLESLSAQTADHHVIVVDNGSEDGTGTLVEQRYPGAELVRLDQNHGFAGGVTSGIKAGRAPHVVLVNNDVECDPAFVERIVEPLRSDSRVGMVAGLLLQPGRRTIDSFGLECDATLSAFARFAGEHYSAGAPALHTRHLLGPSGGAAAYARSALEAAGGFDERMFAYMEDVDLALRLRALGWSAAGAEEAVGVHLGSATIGRRSRAQVRIAGASRGYMLRKYGVLRRGVSTAAWTLAVEAGVVAVETVAGRDLAALRGRLAGWSSAAGIRAPIPEGAVNPELSLRQALRRRRAVLG
jgi:N-acetylglucosaminyl-diphospho-decaprenol L-rhamnosyltransferase